MLLRKPSHTYRLQFVFKLTVFVVENLQDCVAVSAGDITRCDNMNNSNSRFEGLKLNLLNVRFVLNLSRKTANLLEFTKTKPPTSNNSSILVSEYTKHSKILPFYSNYHLSRKIIVNG